jgi:hypothetical protein
VTLNRREKGGASPVIYRLLGPRENRADGALHLSAPERESLGEGALELTVHTAEAPGGSLRAPLRLPSGS